MDNILVATDFSDSSQNAIELAKHLAIKAYASITLLHVSTVQIIDPVAPAFYLDTLIQEKQKDSINQLENIKGQMQDVLYPDKKPIHINTKSVIGIPSSEIATTAEKPDVSLVVTGAKKGDFWTKLAGSTVVELLDMVQKPLLVVPEKVRFRKMDSIVAATNLENGDREFLKNVIQFARVFNAHVLIIHVSENSDKEEQRFQRLKQEIVGDLEYGKVHFENVRIEDKNTSRIIDLVAELDNADLIAMRRIDRDFISELFHRSMTKDMVYHTEVPLIIFR